MTRSILLVLALTACGGTPHAPSVTSPTPAPTSRTPGPEHTGELETLETPPRPKLLSIDWSKVRITTDADALALWRQLGLTGADWRDKLDEVPRELHRAMAIALVREGNFTCVPAKPARECSIPVFDVPEPAPTAGQTDPCLRRLLGMWAIERLEPDDVTVVGDGLKVIAAIPPPESQLTVAALKAIPESDSAKRLELYAIAFAAGQRDIVNGSIGTLDEDHLIEAVTKFHIDGALDSLAAGTQRPTFLAAVADDKLPAKARIAAIGELVSADDKLAADLQKALVTATSTADCTVAAAAARALVTHGEAKFAPRKPRNATQAQAMRSLCVLASYELRTGSDEESLLQSFIPARGIEKVTVTYDALSDSDPDGDGDPHTAHVAELVPRAQAVIPEAEDFATAIKSCKGTTCSSDNHEFKLIWKPVGGELMLARIEIADRPPCPRS